jgi:hypothetical protein
MLTEEKRENLQQHTLGGRSSKAALYRKIGSCDRVTKCITSTRCIDRQKREAFKQGSRIPGLAQTPRDFVLLSREPLFKPFS